MATDKGQDSSHVNLLCSYSYKKVLSSKENIGIDAWYKISRKFTMLRFSKPHDLFHFHVNYREMGTLITQIRYLLHLIAVSSVEDSPLKAHL